MLNRLFYLYTKQFFMKPAKIIGANFFISQLTKYRLTKEQLHLAVVYLRAKKCVFYDTWSRDYCMYVDNLVEIKPTVLTALEFALKN